jgi:cyclophilin family peptidyl-prolyl cis-trans isomerase/HEAT repeat protein
MRLFTLFFLISTVFVSAGFTQVNRETLVKIIKLEDSRTYDRQLEIMMTSGPRSTRSRAILAAGRIGDERAIPTLTGIVRGSNIELATHALFALGEIESMEAKDIVLFAIKRSTNNREYLMRAVEAAGKIAGAHPNTPGRDQLGVAILDYLESVLKSEASHRDGIIAGLTAVIRARPKDGDFVVAKFLTNLDPRVRADAGNTLSRIGNKGSVETLEAMLMSDRDPVARANAARAIGVAESRSSVPLLLQSALDDSDSRVRVSAIRSLGTLRDVAVTEKLVERGDVLLADFKKSSLPAPSEKNEILEIVTALGILVAQTENVDVLTFIEGFRVADKVSSPETEIAMARIAPLAYAKSLEGAPVESLDEEWMALSAIFQGLGTIARLPDSEKTVEAKRRARVILARFFGEWSIRAPEAKARGNAKLAIIQLINAFAAFKSDNLPELFQAMILEERDAGIRGALATALGDTAATEKTIRSLKDAFELSLRNDTDSNGAVLATMNAIFKLDKNGIAPILETAMKSEDSLIRRRAVELLRETKDSRFSANVLSNALRLTRVSNKSDSRLGQLILGNSDYLRAATRRNGQTKAIVKTEKGSFTIDLLPEDAPLTVDNFISLARKGYYNGLVVHRVVPNFVIQDGDPRGDGMGGPGTNIRCEINTVPYDRGAVGMALSGKDTGGSQWFVTHSPQPHLDGGYTVFGRVPESDMAVVDSIARGDKIISITIVGR